jgi:hypothetical protein
VLVHSYHKRVQCRDIKKWQAQLKQHGRMENEVVCEVVEESKERFNEKLSPYKSLSSFAENFFLRTEDVLNIYMVPFSTNSTLITLQYGSRVYGTATETSDFGIYIQKLSLTIG